MLVTNKENRVCSIPFKSQHELNIFDNLFYFKNGDMDNVRINDVLYVFKNKSLIECKQLQNKVSPRDIVGINEKTKYDGFFAFSKEKFDVAIRYCLLNKNYSEDFRERQCFVNRKYPIFSLYEKDKETYYFVKNDLTLKKIMPINGNLSTGGNVAVVTNDDNHEKLYFFSLIWYN